VLPGGKSGIDLATQAHGRWPDLKAVLISGYPEADLVEKGLRKNQFPLLSKPFRKNDLLAVLETEFRNKNAAETAPPITGSVAV
jgi:YesN/AraC family two-component response regulator